MSMDRRHFLSASFIAALSAALPAQGARPRRVLLRSSWQTVNIGDIGHTPGMLALLEKHLPDVEVRLWPSNVGNGVKEMLQKRFPKVAIVEGVEMLRAALAECDFLLHGSGPSLVAEKHVRKWRDETGKPYGVAGITNSSDRADLMELLSGAKFVYFRDPVSLQHAKEHGCKCPVREFGPDGAFGVDLRNDEAALAFLKANGLEEGGFLCCIPRLRYTPYWKIHGKAMTEEDRRKSAYSTQMKEHDHTPLREAIAAVVRETSLKVLICPEDRSQMEVGREMLLEPLPAEVKAKVVWRQDYWLTDEAVSTYARSAGLFGNEMHSPIMCIGNGIPAIVCRFKEQTSKGLMWREIGLGEWLFDLDDEEEVKRIAPAVLALAKDPDAARAKAAKARAFVNERQAAMMKTLGSELGRA